MSRSVVHCVHDRPIKAKCAACDAIENISKLATDHILLVAAAAALLTKLDEMAFNGPEREALRAVLAHAGRIVP